ncbi:MAG: hypothetical protein OXG50_10345 [bacterium]|nr:hypothetical protein [bacterium]
MTPFRDGAHHTLRAWGRAWAAAVVAAVVVVAAAAAAAAAAVFRTPSRWS